MNVSIQGLGPRFRLLLNLSNEGQELATDLQVSLRCSCSVLKARECGSWTCLDFSLVQLFCFHILVLQVQKPRAGNMLGVFMQSASCIKPWPVKPGLSRTSCRP